MNLGKVMEMLWNTSPYGPPRNDTRVCCTQPTQVLVLYGPKELRIENSSKMKVRKVYLPRRENKRLLFKLRSALYSQVQKLDTLWGIWEDVFILLPMVPYLPRAAVSGLVLAAFLEAALLRFW
jgi:hypothetical protein